MRKTLGHLTVKTALYTDPQCEALEQLRNLLKPFKSGYLSEGDVLRGLMEFGKSHEKQFASFMEMYLK
jgi:hypothetical protein